MRLTPRYSTHVHRRRFMRSRYNNVIESLESRTLMTAIAGFTIPNINIPGINIPSLNNLSSLLSFGGITNIIGSYNSYLTLNTNDQWWLDNSGQTLSHHPSGPATGTPDADIDATEAWNITRGSSNVVVAVLDTGIDLNNTTLASHLWTNIKDTPGDGVDNDHNGLVDDIHGWNFIDNSNNVSDNFVHGTATASAILTVAPDTTIMPVEIGTAAGANDANVIKGIQYVIAQKKAGVNIVAINASYISYSAPSQGLINAIKAAGDAGILFNAAAGNAGMNFESLIPSFVQGYISSYLPSNLIFVAATDNHDNLASFSDYGKHIVSVGAPGVDMTLPIPGGLYAPLSGTSFAAPMVSGIAALLKARVPNATMAQIKAAILNSGDSVPSLAGKTITGKRVNANSALNYLIGQQTPTGGVTTIDSSVIQGWAFDGNLGAAPADVQVSIDGTLYDAISADISQPDLLAKLGSTDHGFSFDVPELAYGKHAVKVYALDNATGKSTLLKSATIIVNTGASGVMESADPLTLVGWAQDSDTPTTSAKVRLYVDGKLKTTVTANLTRDDLAEELGSANHGFSIKLTGITPGIHRFDLYALDTMSGEQTLFGSTVLDTNHPPTGAIESLTATTLTGWAFDQDSGASAIQIQYQIDDFAPVLATANASRADLQATLGSKSHGFKVTLPKLAAGDHTVTAWAVDPKNKQLVLLGSQTMTVVDPEGNLLPRGAIEDLSTTSISGWAFDGSAPGTPVKVRIDIDNKAGTAFLANTTRDDLSEALSNPAFGFTKALKLAPGQHRVTLYAYDKSTLVLLGSRIVGVAEPVGSIDSATPMRITGSVYSPALTTRTATFRIDIDGMIGSLYTTTLSRPDLLSITGAGTWGFSIVTPGLMPGDHTISLLFVDPLTLATTSLASGPLIIL